jgi:hypothetical protein
MTIRKGYIVPQVFDRAARPTGTSKRYAFTNSRRKTILLRSSGGNR